MHPLTKRSSRRINLPNVPIECSSGQDAQVARLLVRTPQRGHQSNRYYTISVSAPSFAVTSSSLHSKKSRQPSTLPLTIPSCLHAPRRGPSAVQGACVGGAPAVSGCGVRVGGMSASKPLTVRRQFSKIVHCGSAECHRGSSSLQDTGGNSAGEFRRSSGGKFWQADCPT